MRVPSARPAAAALALAALAPLTTGLARGQEPPSYATGTFSVKLGVFLQVGAWHLEESPDEAFVRNARLSASGRAFLPVLSYVVEVDAGEPGPIAGLERPSRDARLTDAFLALRVRRSVTVRVGQFRPPFDLFHMMNPRYEMFPEQPAGTYRLNPGYDAGLMASGAAFDERLEGHAAVTDESYAARLAWQNRGGFAYRATAIAHPERLEYTAGLAHLTIDRGGGGNETALEAFGALRARRVQVNATHQRWRLPGGADLTYSNLDAGVFLTRTLELIGRRGRTDGDERLDEARLGVAWYARGPNLKFVLDAGRTKPSGDGGSGSGSGSGTPASDEFRLLASYFF